MRPTIDLVRFPQCDTLEGYTVCIITAAHRYSVENVREQITRFVVGR